MEDDKRRLHVGKCRIQHFLHMATSSGYFQLSKLPIIFWINSLIVSQNM